MKTVSGQTPVDVLELRDVVSGKLVYLVNLKSLNNYKNLLQCMQKVNVGGILMQTRYYQSTVEELYKRQFDSYLSTEVFSRLEKQLYYKDRDIEFLKTSEDNSIVISIKKQTLTVKIDGVTFVYNIKEIYSFRLYCYLKTVRPEKINEQNLAFYEIGLKIPLAISQHLKFKTEL